MWILLLIDPSGIHFLISVGNVGGKIRAEASNASVLVTLKLGLTNSDRNTPLWL